MRSWSGLVLIGIMAAMSVAMAGQLPEVVPVHWGLSGMPDGWGSRWVNLLLAPGLSLLLWLAWGILPRLDPVRASYDSFKATVRRYGIALLAFFTVLHGALLAASAGWPFDFVRVLLVGLGLLLAALGNEMGRLERNAFMGLRLPWVMADDALWTRSNRAAGRAFFIAGLLLVPLALLLPMTLLVYAALGVLGIALVWVVGYSYVLALHARRAGEAE